MRDEHIIIGGAGGSSKTSTATTVPAPVEAANTLHSVATATVVDLLCEGPIKGLCNGQKSIYFNDTPLLGASGAYNFSRVATDVRLGTPDQSYLPGFSDVEATVILNTQVKNAVPVVSTISNLNVDAVRVTVKIPALWAIDKATGNVNGNAFNIAVDVRPFGGAYTRIVGQVISGKCVSPYERSYQYAGLQALGAGPWDVKVTRSGTEYDSVTAAGDLYFDSLTAIISHRLIYPDSALAGVSCDARSFAGSIPSRSYEIFGLQMQVPNNYDPLTRRYRGTWDGTFVTAWSDNPAWVFYSLATNPRFGLGGFISATQLDKWQLYAIAQYCDQFIGNGRGSTEPRHSFNGVIATRDEAYRVMLSLASVFRGMVYWSSGAIFVTADMPDDPVKLLAPANVLGGEFQYEGASLKSRHSVALVTWINPANSYQQDIEVVEDADAIEALGYRPIEIAAVGCTSRSQARRFGKWVLYIEQHETEVVHYTCSWDHADVSPGSLVAIADPAYAGVRFGGRLVGATTTTLSLDGVVTLDGSQTYSVDVVLPDGAIETASVVFSQAGETSDLVLAAALSATPSAGAIWVLSGSNVEPRLFRVVSVVEKDKGVFTVSALFHDPTKYDEVEKNLKIEDIDYTTLPSGPLLAPSNLSTMQSLYLGGAGAVFGAVTVSWTLADDPRVTRYEMSISRNGLDFQSAGLTNVSTYEVDGIAITETSIGFRVRSVDDLGRASDWLTAASIATTMFKAPPADVTDFGVNVLGDTAILKWTPVTSLGLDHYVVRFTPLTTGATWGTAQIIQPHVVGAAAQLPAMVGTYLIKAVSLAGVESVNAALITSNVTGLTNMNVVVTVDPAPGWVGSRFDVEVSGGTLRLAAAARVPYTRPWLPGVLGAWQPSQPQPQSLSRAR